MPGDDGNYDDDGDGDDDDDDDDGGDGDDDDDDDDDDVCLFVRLSIRPHRRTRLGLDGFHKI